MRFQRIFSLLFQKKSLKFKKMIFWRFDNGLKKIENEKKSNEIIKLKMKTINSKVSSNKRLKRWNILQN